MNNIIPKDLLKIVVDTAKEISASGETIHQTFGELSISLERLLTKTIKVSEGSDGSKVTETKEWLVNNDKQKGLVTEYYEKAFSLLDKVYDNQRQTKILIFNIAFLIFMATVIIFFALPLMLNAKPNFSISDEKLSSIVSIIVAVIISIASFFQWWNIDYNGGMKTKTWVKIFFGFCIILLIIALYFLLK